VVDYESARSQEDIRMSFVNACRTNCVSLQENRVQEIKVVGAHKGTWFNRLMSREKMLKYFFECCGKWKIGMGNLHMQVGFLSEVL